MWRVERDGVLIGTFRGEGVECIAGTLYAVNADRIIVGVIASGKGLTWREEAHEIQAAG